MRAATPDMTRLSALALDQRRGLEPVVLRVQADLFAAARQRDATAIAAFQELARTLLPKVDDATAAHVARRVAMLEETPLDILHLLADRGGACARLMSELRPGMSAGPPAAEPVAVVMTARQPDLDPDRVEALLALSDPAVDDALVRNGQARLQGQSLYTLVERARARPELARLLVVRDDLPADDLACLYLHAGTDRRAAIRQHLASSPSPRNAVLRRAPQGAVASLLTASDAGDAVVFGSRLSALLELANAPEWRFDRAERHDLLALALLAAGIDEEDCIRVFLTLHPVIARSVATVFGLTAIVRETPRSVAARLLEAILDLNLGARKGRFQPGMAPGGTPSRPGLFGQIARAAPELKVRRERR